MLCALVIGGVVSAPAQPPTARAVAERALRAVEHDSTAAVRAEWAQRVREDGAVSHAALGLASLDALTYLFDEAARRYEQIRTTSRDSSLMARAALGLGGVRQAQGQYRDSGEPLQQAVVIASAIGDSATHAEALIMLAGARTRTQGLLAGLAALDSADRVTPTHDARVRVVAQCTRASLHALLGKDDVRELARAGAALAQRIGHRRAQAACVFAEGQYLTQRGDLITADARMRDAADLQRASRHRAALAANLQWRGYLLTTVASFGSALELLREALVEAEASNNQSVLAWANANLASIYATLNDRYLASHHAVVAERLMQEQGDRRGLALVRGLRAELAMRAADTVEASRLGDEAQRLIAEYGSPELENQVWGWRLSRYAVAKDWSAAHAMLDSMRANLRRRGGEGWLKGQNFSRAALALLEGDYVAAERALSEFGDPRAHQQPIQRYQIQVMWAELRARTGRFEEAERELREASDVIDAWRAHADSRALRHLAFQRSNEFGDPDFSVATVLRLLATNGRAESAFELAERRRARQLGDELARASALRGVQQDSVLPARALPRSVTARQVTDALPDDQTALIEYVTGRGGEVTTAFIMTRLGMQSVALVPIDSVAATISRFVGLLEAGGPAERQAAELGERLLEPILRALPTAVRRLLIVPDDVLHRLPFDAVRLADGRYAIERYTISTVPSAAIAVMLLERPARTSPVRLLALGDPLFSSESASPGDSALRRSLVRRGELMRLAASGREAERVARFAPEAEVRLRETASEHYFKAARLDTFHVIHLATHAFVDDRAIGRSVLALAAGDGEDGFVTPGDVAALTLQAELVVLSACRTAGGVLLGGEGVHGLAAPFLGAGARTVVATSWQVDDRRAAALIERFYRALADGESLGDALRTAKLDALQSGLSPREWASWSLIGDPIAGVPLQRPPSRMPWWLAAGALAAALYYGSRTVNRWKREIRSAPSA